MRTRIKEKLIANLVDICYVEVVRLPGIHQNASIRMVFLTLDEPNFLVFVGTVRIIAEFFTRRHREPRPRIILLQLYVTTL